MVAKYLNCKKLIPGAMFKLKYSHLSFPLFPIVAILKNICPKFLFLKYSSSNVFCVFLSGFLLEEFLSGIFESSFLPSLIGFDCFKFLLLLSLVFETLLPCLFNVCLRSSLDLLLVWLLLNLFLFEGGLQLIDCCLGLLIGFLGSAKFLECFRFLVF